MMMPPSAIPSPPVPPRPRARHGFTLIELLVVISIIVLLIALLLPALSMGRRSARVAICLSNLHQISVATVNYESDNGRMPAHVDELDGIKNSVPNMIANDVASPPSGDARPLWARYMDVSYFRCPLLLSSARHPSTAAGITEYNPATSPASNIYMPYFLAPGYFGDGSGATYTTRWTRSYEPFTYGTKKFDVIAGDLVWNGTGTWGSYFVNHAAEGGNGFVASWIDQGAGASNAAASNCTIPWTAALPDPRLKHTVNYCFADGSGKTLGQWASSKMVSLPLRFAGWGDYLLPSRN